MDVLNHLDNHFFYNKIHYQDYIEKGYCPFIPGVLLDEYYRLISLVVTSRTKLPYPYDGLRKFYDLSLVICGSTCL